MFAAGTQDGGEGSDESYNSKEESASAAKDSFDSDFDESDGDLEGKQEHSEDEDGLPKKKSKKNVVRRFVDEDDYGEEDR